MKAKMFKQFVKKTVLVSRSSGKLAKRQGSEIESDNTTTDEESSSEDEAFTDLKALANQADLPNEFWQVQ